MVGVTSPRAISLNLAIIISIIIVISWPVIVLVGIEKAFTPLIPAMNGAPA